MTVPKLRFDGTFNFGHVFTGVSMLVTAATMAALFNARLGTVEFSLAAHDSLITSLRTDLAAVLPVIAVDQQRLNTLENSNERMIDTVERIDGRLTSIQVDLSAIRAAGNTARTSAP